MKKHFIELLINDLINGHADMNMLANIEISDEDIVSGIPSVLNS